MSTWPGYPLIYEINAWVWLDELGRKYRKPVDLASVPEQEWDAIASQGFDAVWLMGIWERSPAGIEISLRNAGLLEDFRRALPDFSAEDNVGSPYCVRCYEVDTHLGGPNGLDSARCISPGKGRAAAVAMLTLPGAKLLHEGQFEGRKVRLPVFLGRRPAEPPDQDLVTFYQRLLRATHHDVFRNGAWRLCERSGWPDNQSCLNVLS